MIQIEGYGFYDEWGLKVGQTVLYSSKISELGVLDNVSNKKSLVEPLVNVGFLNHSRGITPKQENEHVGFLLKAGNEHVGN